MVLLLAGLECDVNIREAPVLAPFSNDQLRVILFWLMVLWGPLLALAPALLVGMSATARRQVLSDRPKD
jgi:hypothetical protein